MLYWESTLAHELQMSVGMLKRQGAFPVVCRRSKAACCPSRYCDSTAPNPMLARMDADVTPAMSKAFKH